MLFVLAEAGISSCSHRRGSLFCLRRNRFCRCLLQNVQMLREDLLEYFAHILQHMPAIQHLLCPWRSLACPFEVACSSIPTDDLDSWMSQQPVRENLLIAAQ